MTNETTKKATKTLDKITLIAMAIVGLTITVLYGISSGTNSNMITGKDISGWASLVISGSIGLFVTIVVVIYSDYQQGKTNEVIDSINKVLGEQKQANDRRKNYAVERLKFETSLLESWVKIVVELSADFWHIALDRSGNDNTINEMRINSMFQVQDKEREKILRDLESILGFSNDVLKPETIDKIDSIIRFIHNPISKETPPFPDTMTVQVEWSEPISKLISELRKDLL